MGKDRLRDPRVVVDRFALGEAGLRPQHLVEVGELEPVPVYVYFAAFALLRDLDPALELFELERDLAAAGRFRRLAPSRLPSRFEPAASGSPWIAARLSSSAAIRSGALVGVSSSRYSSRYLSASKSVLSDSISCCAISSSRLDSLRPSSGTTSPISSGETTSSANRIVAMVSTWPMGRIAARCSRFRSTKRATATLFASPMALTSR